MKNNTILISVVIAIIVGAIGFFGGMQYQKSQRPTNGFGGSGQAGANRGQRNGGGPGGMGNRPVAGEIISSDDKSITVKLQDGSSKIVLLSGSTQINKADTATISDLKTGEKVAVFGTANSDGSVTAQNVQLNPMQRMFGQGSPSPSPQ